MAPLQLANTFASQSPGEGREGIKSPPRNEVTGDLGMCLLNVILLYTLWGTRPRRITRFIFEALFITYILPRPLFITYFLIKATFYYILPLRGSLLLQISFSRPLFITYFVFEALFITYFLFEATLYHIFPLRVRFFPKALAWDPSNSMSCHSCRVTHVVSCHHFVFNINLL